MKDSLLFLAPERLTVLILIVIALVSACGSLLPARRSAKAYPSDAFPILLALLFVLFTCLGVSFPLRGLHSYL